MCTKNKILISLILIIYITSFSASASANDGDLRNGDMLLLKTGHVNTTESIEPQNEFIFMSSSISADISNYYIVQFSGPATEQWKKNVSSKGAEFYTYVPNNAFIVRMNKSVKNQVHELDFVKWIGEYTSSYKYDPEIAADSGNQNSFLSFEKENSQIYYISLFSAEEYTETVGSLEALGVEVLGGYGKVISVRATTDQIDDIASITGISWIEEYIQPTIHNDVAAGIITTDVVHDTYGLKGTNQTVAVADTGIDIGVDNESMHADLRDRIVAIFDIAGDGTAADLVSGHGTHVSGSVLGNGSLSGGQYAGMAPEAELVFQALSDGSDNLYLPSGGLEELFQQAYNAGARIHTNSWGADTYGEYTVFSQQVDQFMWDNPDMLILFSAGNEGTDSNSDGVVDLDSIGSPATAKNCLTVGASENNRSALTNTYGISWPSDYPAFPIHGDRIADDSSGIAAFSSRGPTDDGRIKPDVVSPGTFIISARSSVASGTGWGVVNDDYLYMGGTSMSTPITAGTAALVREYYTEVENLSRPSAALLKATIINGACNITPGQYGTGEDQEIDGRYDYSQGWGRVDIENSIYPQSPVVMDYYDYVPLNDSDSWNVSYNILYTSEPVRITLVWTDYPPADISDTSNLTLVNNLDLIVEGPEGTYYGNGAPDIRNNVEGIELLEPAAGTYTITVNGTQINAPVSSPAQNFSLVISYGEVSNIYMYPEHNSYTTNASTEVYMNLTHADGINSSSIDMQIDGSSVLASPVPISGGYKIENKTSQPYSEGFHNVSVSALTGQDEELNYGWRFYVSVEDNILTIQSPLENTVIQDNTVTINASSNKWCDLWYNIDNGVNSTSQSGYSLNTSTELGEGNYNITVFAEDITGSVNSTSLNFTVFTESADIDSPDSGSIYYLPDNSFTLNGTVGVATNISVYVNGALTNGSEPVSGGTFNVSNVPLSNGTNTINVSAMYNNSLTDYFVANTTIYLSLGQTVDTSSSDLITITVPGIDTNVSNPVFNFNVSGTSSNPGNISASVVRGSEPGNGSSLTGTVLDIRVFNESDPDNSYNFGRNVSLSLGYDPYLVNNTGKLTVAWYDPDEEMWVPYRSAVNSTAHTVTANITHLSIYAPVEDNTAPIMSNLTNSSTSSTIALEWNSSEDTDHVEIWTDGSLLGNYSGSGVTVTGLSAGTLYNYSLRAVDYVGNTGDWYNTSVMTTAAISTSSSTSSSGGGGGGGGGGSTGEDADNIAFKDVLSVYAGKDDLVDFDFTKEQNEIDYVRYTSLKNAGKITVTIEMLKNTSALVDEAPPGLIYRNMNIWVGKTGYATEGNIQDPVIGFMVSKEWTDDNEVKIATISLNRYNEGLWTKLDTKQTGSDDSYYYFEASTSGFSPFAITADLPITLDAEEGENDKAEAAGASLEQTGAAEVVETEELSVSNTDGKVIPAVSGVLTLVIFTFALIFVRKQQD